MATLKEIAKLCNVSTATVSKALNNAPDIGPKTAARIRAVCREQDYRPNAAARALKTNRTHNIGVLFSDDSRVGLTHEYFVHILNAVKASAEAHGYDITFISSDIGADRMRYLEHCRYRGCDGVVIANVSFSDPNVIELASSEIPIVSIDYSFFGSSAVFSDNPGGMQDLVNYVYSMGHRSLAFVHGEDTAVTRSRLAGFYRTCRDLNIPVREDWVLPSRYHDTVGCRDAIRKLMSGKDRPTCIFCPDDISIYGGISELAAMGLSVPDDISVVGYDGIPLSRQLTPVLTTMCQDSEQLGTTAVELLLEAIEQPKTLVPRHVVIPGKLQAGATVARIG